MTHDDILKHLRASGSEFLSGAELAAALGVSRTAIWKQIKALERAGYCFEAVPSKGYRLLHSPDVLTRAALADGLRTRAVGREIILLTETGSTNTIAMELANKGAVEGTVVFAEAQTGGRGRMGRRWASPRGNLYLSVVLRPAVPVHKAPAITLMAAVAVASVIREHLKVPAGIKWPNDILIAGKKAAGVLTEMSAEPDRIRHLVFGIGVNVNMDMREAPDDVRRTATTLAAAAGRRIDRSAFAQALLAGLDRWYQRFLGNAADVIEAWREMSVTLGSRVAVQGSGLSAEGTAVDVDAEGRLLLQLDDGVLQQISAGDVTILKGRP